ncbi:MAG: hypothetical protein JW776_08680 [Candidatus Lokiarchaeota archaeon]|nr:hypothetical protein [Candidatus Lokiarchaeota archaeon]
MDTSTIFFLLILEDKIKDLLGTYLQSLAMRSAIENNIFLFEHDTESEGKIGSIQIKRENERVSAITQISMKLGHKKLKVLSYSTVRKSNGDYELKVTLTNGVDLLLMIKDNSPVIYINSDFQGNFSNRNLILIIQINFFNSNQYDYINLSGNKYRKVENPQNFSLKVPPTGAFGQVWTIHSGALYSGIIGLNQPEIQNFRAKFNANEVLLSQKIKVKKQTKFCIIAGRGDFVTPIKEKLLNILPMDPLPIKYQDNLKTEAILSFNTLYEHFLLESKSGKMPSSFINCISDKNKGYIYDKMGLTTIGNCFSLGYITGTMALYSWMKDGKYLNILSKEFLPPLLDDSLIQTGPIAGAYLDTYNEELDYWTTGRIQDPKKGFTGFFPIERDKKGRKVLWNLPPIKDQLKNGVWHFLVENFLIFFREINNPGAFKKYELLVVSPPFSGQIAYNLFQVLLQLSNEHSSSDSIDAMKKRLRSAIQLTIEFLMKYQREDGLWDQELREDGEIFWDRKTLACIYPATLLFWWGFIYKDDIIQDAGSAALHACLNLLEDGEYYGIYFETDAANHQGDLVTAVGCIKCFSKLYELTKENEWLDHARSAAWHLLSYMWGSGVRDIKNNIITGGLPVTTYKSMGFPVIGGSELCQAIESLLELAIWDRTFLKYAEAGFGFHSHYMYFQHNQDRATNEIMWGTLENWSTSTSVDFASYATGPFIRALYLYNVILNRKK